MKALSLGLPLLSAVECIFLSEAVAPLRVAATAGNAAAVTAAAAAFSSGAPVLDFAAAATDVPRRPSRVPSVMPLAAGPASEAVLVERPRRSVPPLFKVV